MKDAWSIGLQLKIPLMSHSTGETQPSGELNDLGPAPLGDFKGFRVYWQKDLVSGFLVFLIALPLCLGIALASGCPAIAGVFTAIVGGLVTPWISNSELTIKGPAAGMIAIIAGAVAAFTPPETSGLTHEAASMIGYQSMLAVGVAAGLLQVAFGWFRLGALGEFFPVAAVHGMLAAIGLIIISKQSHVMLQGVPLQGVSEPLRLLELIPHSIAKFHGEAAFIGVVSLLILIVRPYIKLRLFQIVPGPMWVIMVALPLSVMFDLDHRYLVSLPAEIVSAVHLPNFSNLLTPVGLKWVIMFALVGSVESLLSAKAVDLLDPWKRHTDLNRDLLSVGVANTLVAFIGGLPMISEIVRSSANCSNAARTRWANFFHGLLLLFMVVTFAEFLDKIPLSALAAMLVFTGYRLASPAEFKHMFHIGKGEFAVFITTLVVTLLTDLLVGIGVGMLAQLLLLVFSGAPLTGLFKVQASVTTSAKEAKVAIEGAAVFSNWSSLYKHLQSVAYCDQLTLDFSKANLVDHSVMMKIEEMRNVWSHQGRELIIFGMEHLDAVSGHPFSTRKLATET